jgi:putative molybdopterin biosynthesis protein
MQIQRRKHPNLASLPHREEGLILTRGNQRGISGFSDVVRLHFANRGPGPAVGVLVDHILNGHMLGKHGLPGYETELFTHLEVSTAVAEGRADVGVGTLAPARSLGLDFAHLTWERYTCSPRKRPSTGGRRKLSSR